MPPPCGDLRTGQPMLMYDQEGTAGFGAPRRFRPFAARR